MARSFGSFLVLVLLYPEGGFSRTGSRIAPRDSLIPFETGLGPFEAEEWENGSTWIQYSYEDLEKELNRTAPRPPGGGGSYLAKLNIKETSAGSFMTLPKSNPVTGLTIIFDYFLQSSLDRAASVRIEYQKGNSGYKNLAEFYAPWPNDGQFHTATADLSFDKPENVTIRVYGNGDGGNKPDIVTIDDFRIRTHLGPLLRKERAKIQNAYASDQKITFSGKNDK